MVIKKRNEFHPWLPYFICGLASTFYIYDFIIRVIPGTIPNELMQQYHIDAGGLGLLSSLFFIGYMTMQIPCGLLYDIVGPRVLMAATIFIAAIATFFFILSNNFVIAMLARFFMGFGSAFAYIGPLVLVSRWIRKKHYVMAIGIIQLLGSLGAIIGEAPLVQLTSRLGVFNVITFIALIGVILAIAFLIFLIDYPPTSKYRLIKPKIKIIPHLKYILKNPQNWAIALYGFAIWAPISIFASLWAISFLSQRYDISDSSAATLSSLLWIGVGLGGPFFGWYTNFFKSRRSPLIFASLLGLLSSLIILYVKVPEPIIIILLFLFGVAGSAQAVTFGALRDNNSQRHVGTAAGFNNMAIVLGGAILQPVVGVLLDRSQNNYQFALALLPILFAMSLCVVLFLIRETNCKFIPKSKKQLREIIS